MFTIWQCGWFELPLEWKRIIYRLLVTLTFTNDGWTEQRRQQTEIRNLTKLRQLFDCSIAKCLAYVRSCADFVDELKRKTTRCIMRSRNIVVRYTMWTRGLLTVSKFIRCASNNKEKMNNGKIEEKKRQKLWHSFFWNVDFACWRHVLQLL